MLLDVHGEALTKERLKRIRRRLKILSAAETEQPCFANKLEKSNFLLAGQKCSFCGVPRKLHQARGK